MSYTRRKIEGGVGAMRESDDTNFLKPNGQSRDLNIYGSYISEALLVLELTSVLSRGNNSDAGNMNQSCSMIYPRENLYVVNMLTV